MKLLAIETSTLMGSVAVVEDSRVLCELTLYVHETHSSQLMTAVDYALKAAGATPDQLDGFAVALGPGSFTGLRIGMATVKGLATAASKPIVGIPTLEAMAWSFPYCPYLLCPIIDARMNEVYAAWFRAEAGRIVRESEDMVLATSKLLGTVKEDVLLFGSGVQRYHDEISGILGEHAHFATPDIMGARASLVGFLAVERLRHGEASDMDSLEPLYIRESQAIQKARPKGTPSGT
jgi:tRNA threonylcarbamoyladenosine biosynthesis protein TsaB